MKALSNIEEEEKETPADITYLEYRHTKLSGSVIETAIESFEYLNKANLCSNIGMSASCSFSCDFRAEQRWPLLHRYLWDLLRALKQEGERNPNKALHECY